MENFTYIQINNLLIDERTEFHLTSEEIYVYSLLSTSRNLRGQIFTTPSTIHDMGHIKLASSQKRAVLNIKNTLISLRDKKVIRFTNADGELTNAFKANDTLIVELSEFDTKYFTQLDFEVFDEIKDIRHLHVYLAVFKWANSGDGTFGCSKSRWANILKCSESTAFKAVNEAVEEGLIHKNIGDYNDTGKQNTNRYRTTPFEDDEITNHSFNKKYVEKEIVEETSLEHFNVEALKETEQRFNTFKDEDGKDVFPIEQDYIAFLDLQKQKREIGLTDFEKRVLRAGEKRINKLKKQKALIDEDGVAFKIVDRYLEQAKLAIECRDEFNS
ncbi:hypothetical protein FC756_25300 [Lysinibacillus mangiferihumi]|uniref:Uncharacterized protein n=1 Tax=Lysinibacillus mangiferihumi TaxID=1130819 RepID=A0A4U2Y272_9BACI|nr:hypothetical protein [Lysinibacillus mangiferihumi]TKI53191.1 hypothetical protein FC756_25300 [Lysinibacillus mangiferihumi]